MSVSLNKVLTDMSGNVMALKRAIENMTALQMAICEVLVSQGIATKEEIDARQQKFLAEVDQTVAKERDQGEDG